MKINKIFNTIMAVVAAGALCSCSADADPKVKCDFSDETEEKPVVIDRTAFATGADISWVTEFEAKGIKFTNAEGNETDLFPLLRDECGVNAIRLRVWVNPVEGWNSIHDVVVKARRANALGQRVMIDFHFSDTWADPGHQDPPAAWAEMDYEELSAAMKSHITTTLQALLAAGVEAEWVQIGNETPEGMMLPVGGLDQHFADLVTDGCEAVKSVLPNAKVIVHCDQGENYDRFVYLFSRLTNAKYDMIGCSTYPDFNYPDPSDWVTAMTDVVKNMKKLADRYSKRIMVCEVGFPWDEEEAAAAAMKVLVKEAKASGVIDGIFYWEPETTPTANGYEKGCFDENGAPTSVLKAYLQ